MNWPNRNSPAGHNTSATPSSYARTINQTSSRRAGFFQRQPHFTPVVPDLFADCQTDFPNCHCALAFALFRMTAAGPSFVPSANSRPSGEFVTTVLPFTSTR